MDNLEIQLQKHQSAGVGECGLDRRFYRTAPRPEQEKLLLRHIELAGTYRRPLVLHQVKAAGALADLLSSVQLKTPVMIHGFNSPPEILERFLKLDLYISVGPGSRWENEAFIKTARMIPRNRLLLETDWPYGGMETNYTQCLEAHYRRTAEALDTDIEELKRIVKTNGTVFTNRPPDRAG